MMNTKKLKLPYGIPGHNLSEIEREVSNQEPDAWPVNDQLKHVGKRVKRYDAEAKVTGKAKYTADMQLPGMLYAKFLRSNVPAATITSIDISKAEKHPGVYAVHVIKNVLSGAQEEGGSDSTYPEIKFAGQPIAGVAAETLDIAEEAIKLIRVDYKLQPFVIDVEEAQKPEAPLVFSAPVVQKEDAGDVGVTHDGDKGQGNVRGPSTSSFFGGPRGDLAKGFAEADVIVERVYRTQVHTHVPLETHGVVVDWKPEGMTVWVSTQNTKQVRNEMAEYFDLPNSKVRVICEYMGGGFGAKHSAGNFGPMAGILSKKPDGLSG
jgi:xanthine dehydrogenase YagR molybdenum-binding subunit